MPNDAKFGLVVGVGLVITVAVVFFQKTGSSDPAAAIPATGEAELSAATPPPSVFTEAGNAAPRGPVEARTMQRTKARESSGPPENPAESPPSQTPAMEEKKPAGPANASLSPPRFDEQLVRSSEERRHIVVAGETLFTIAERYYGDGDKFIILYRTNRDVLKNPDRLPPGTSIRIP